MSVYFLISRPAPTDCFLSSHPKQHAINSAEQCLLFIWTLLTNRAYADARRIQGGILDCQRYIYFISAEEVINPASVGKARFSCVNLTICSHSAMHSHPAQPAKMKVDGGSN
ncbi:MAG TPA: hypothetical protein VFE46_04435 [Pirellulales bacterium]|nr:hypothetical protein [Pirellulales bacterium]